MRAYLFLLLIGEFGEERRTPVKIGAVPQKLRQAILAAEDDRFYQHGGIDYLGVLRAAWADLAGGGEVQGASTITMQVARNFFLGREKTFKRKFYEALLALKIEGNLSKDQILELYVNQIYLGERAYGFAAAAEVYFGKPLDKLSLPEMAVLAALPKAPSHDNPVVSPERATERRGYVLRRMHDLKYITDEEYRAARQELLKVHSTRFRVDAQSPPALPLRRHRRRVRLRRRGRGHLHCRHRGRCQRNRPGAGAGAPALAAQLRAARPAAGR